MGLRDPLQVDEHQIKARKNASVLALLDLRELEREPPAELLWLETVLPRLLPQRLHVLVGRLADERVVELERQREGEEEPERRMTSAIRIHRRQRRHVVMDVLPLEVIDLVDKGLILLLLHFDLKREGVLDGGEGGQLLRGFPAFLQLTHLVVHLQVVKTSSGLRMGHDTEEAGEAHLIDLLSELDVDLLALLQLGFEKSLPLALLAHLLLVQLLLLGQDGGMLMRLLGVQLRQMTRLLLLDGLLLASLGQITLQLLDLVL